LAGAFNLDGNINGVLSIRGRQALPPSALSSEVDTGLREENASKQESRAFSSEVDTGSHEENASKQESRALVLIQSEPKL
jgi:hypothetical protein